jgi:twitching motility protein PilT
MMDFALILEQAIGSRASDIHLQEHRCPLFRIGYDLVLTSHAVTTRKDIQHFLQCYGKSESIAEQEPYLRDISFAVDFTDTVRGRIQGFWEQSGYHVVIRLLYPLHQWGLDRDAGLLSKVGTLHDGLVLVTGPTGSGKTTTLWQIIDMINKTRQRHVITLEDPIEYILPSGQSLISQRELGLHFKTYQEGVRQALRQDPDILLIGELRDEGTMDAALTAAETGHLVLSTLHTRSAAQAVTRFAGAFSTGRQDEIRYRLSLTLQAILAQRRVCLAKGTIEIVREILLATPAVSQLIRTGREHQLETVMQTGAAKGMRTMGQAMACRENRR